MKRNRRPKLFRVVREERVRVVFYVETTSNLKARQTPTPAFAERTRMGETVGEALETYSLPGGEMAIAISPVDGEYARPRRHWPVSGAPLTEVLAGDLGDLVELRFADRRFR